MSDAALRWTLGCRQASVGLWHLDRAANEQGGEGVLRLILPLVEELLDVQEKLCPDCRVSGPGHGNTRGTAYIPWRHNKANYLLFCESCLSAWIIPPAIRSGPVRRGASSRCRMAIRMGRYTPHMSYALAERAEKCALDLQCRCTWCRNEQHCAQYWIATYGPVPIRVCLEQAHRNGYTGSGFSKEYLDRFRRRARSEANKERSWALSIMDRNERPDVAPPARHPSFIATQNFWGRDVPPLTCLTWDSGMRPVFMSIALLWTHDTTLDGCATYRHMEGAAMRECTRCGVLTAVALPSGYTCWGAIWVCKRCGLHRDTRAILFEGVEAGFSSGDRNRHLATIAAASRSPWRTPPALGAFKCIRCKKIEFFSEPTTPYVPMLNEVLQLCLSCDKLRSVIWHNADGPLREDILIPAADGTLREGRLSSWLAPLCTLCQGQTKYHWRSGVNEVTVCASCANVTFGALSYPISEPEYDVEEVD